MRELVSVAWLRCALYDWDAEQSFSGGGHLVKSIVQEQAGKGRNRVASRRRQADPAENAADLMLSSLEDDLNRQIVRLLQVDGRMPFKAVAKQLRVSEGTVRNRYMRMRKANVLSVVATADPTSISYRADAMIGIKIASTATPAEVAGRLKNHPEVVYLLWVSGRYDLLAEIVVESEKDFAEFLQAHCYGRSDIASVEVMTSIVMYKNQFLLKSPVQR